MAVIPLGSVLLGNPTMVDLFAWQMLDLGPEWMLLKQNLRTMKKPGQ